MPADEGLNDVIYVRLVGSIVKLSKLYLLFFFLSIIVTLKMIYVRVFKNMLISCTVGKTKLL